MNLRRQLLCAGWIFFLLGAAGTALGGGLLLYFMYDLFAGSQTGTANPGALANMVFMGVGALLLAASLDCFKAGRQFKAAFLQSSIPSTSPVLLAMGLGAFSGFYVAVLAGVYALYVRRRWIRHLEHVGRSP